MKSVIWIIHKSYLTSLINKSSCITWHSLDLIWKVWIENYMGVKCISYMINIILLSFQNNLYTFRFISIFIMFFTFCFTLFMDMKFTILPLLLHNIYKFHSRFLTFFSYTLPSFYISTLLYLYFIIFIYLFTHFLYFVFSNSLYN